MVATIGHKYKDINKIYNVIATPPRLSPIPAVECEFLPHDGNEEMLDVVR